jgi:hypothetical protein
MLIEDSDLSLADQKAMIGRFPNSAENTNQIAFSLDTIGQGKARNKLSVISLDQSSSIIQTKHEKNSQVAENNQSKSSESVSLGN